MARIDHHLDDLWPRRLPGLQRAGERRHLRTRAQELRHLGDGARVDQRLVPLHVEVPVGRQVARRLRDALGAIAAGRVRHQGAKARRFHGARDAPVVGRHRHFVDPGGAAGALRDADDHRRAADVGEGFTGQSLGGVARGNQGCEAHVVL